MNANDIKRFTFPESKTNAVGGKIGIPKYKWEKKLKFKHPSVFLNLGACESGKTTWDKNFILTTQIYNDISIFTKDEKDNSIIELKNHFAKAEKRLGREIVHVYSDIDRLPLEKTKKAFKQHPEWIKFDRHNNNCVILDDFLANDSKNTKKIFQFTVIHKHFGVSLFLPLQSFFSAQKKLRDLVQPIFVVNGLLNEKDFNDIFRPYVGMLFEDGDKKERLRDLYQILLSIKRENPFHALVLDVFNKDRRYRIRDDLIPINIIREKK